jgi:hypothetical protein
LILIGLTKNNAMPTCKQVIELSSTHLETTLPRWQRWRLRLHLLICRHCRRYTKQLRFLQQVSHAVNTNLKNVSLSAAARERIMKNLQQSANK